MAKIGFTGTRNGMTSIQKKEFEKIIDSKEIEEFHDGMCVGSDADAHEIVENKDKKIRIIGHEPTYKKFMNKCRYDAVMKPFDYLQRNKHIVEDTDMLIATPDVKEKIRSGTWSTIRYARKQSKKIYIIHKNGRVTIE